MTSPKAHRFALPLPEMTEEPHFDMSSSRAHLVAAFDAAGHPHP